LLEPRSPLFEDGFDAGFDDGFDDGFDGFDVEPLLPPREPRLPDEDASFPTLPASLDEPCFPL